MSSALCGKDRREGFGVLRSFYMYDNYLYQVKEELWRWYQVCGVTVTIPLLLQKGIEPRESVLCAELASRLVWAHGLNCNCWGRGDFSWIQEEAPTFLKSSCEPPDMQVCGFL